MASSILNSDDGVISGTSGLKSTGGDDGTLAVQSNGTEIAKFKTTELVINDGGANYDFRVEGDTDANLLFVDASTDRVGIGTTSPGSKLTLDGTIQIGAVGSASDVGITKIATRNIRFDSAPSTGTGITVNVGTDANQNSTCIVNGNLLVGKTTSSSTTQGNTIGASLVNFIANTPSPSDGPYIQVGNIAASVANGYRYISFRVNAGGTEVGFISTNGTSSTAYGTSSDYRLKENIAPMTGALDKVAALKPCTYTWKSNGSAGEGFIAHELQAVVPDAVIGEKDAVNEDGSIKPQNIDTSFLVATLTAAIQELKAINDAQAQRIETLEAKVAALEQA